MKFTPEEAIDLIRSRPTVSPTVAAAAMGLSQPHISRLITSGRFPVPAHQMGTRWVIPTPALRELLQLSPTPEDGASSAA